MFWFVLIRVVFMLVSDFVSRPFSPFSVGGGNRYTRGKGNFLITLYFEVSVTVYPFYTPRFRSSLVQFFLFVCTSLTGLIFSFHMNVVSLFI